MNIPIIIQLSKSFLLTQTLTHTSTRCLATSWNPKFRKLRAEKVKKTPIPEYDKIRQSLNADFEKQRSDSKKEGIDPPISFEYRPLNITSSSEIFDAFIPPEGDGKQTILTKEGLSQRFLKIKSAGSKWRHERKITQYDDSFNQMSFSEEAQQIFIDAHEALQNRDKDKLIDLVTEYCYPKMWFQNKFKTLRWKWIQALEPSMVVHMITREMLSKSIIYAQVTVRMHSQQTLAVYDRFGRLAYGDEELVKNVLEYVVFEKNLTNKYSKWRIHDKIIPTWAEAKMPIIKTYYKPKPMKIDETLEDKKPKFKDDEKHLEDIKDDEKPKLATA